MSSGTNTVTAERMLQEYGMPDDAWWTAAEATLETLASILMPKVDGENVADQSLKLRLLPDEAFAARLSCRDDDLACLAFGSMRAELFEEIMWDNLRKHKSLAIRVLDISYANNLTVVIEIAGATFRIRYFKSPEVLGELNRSAEIVEWPHEFIDTLDEDISTSIEDLSLYHTARSLHLHKETNYKLYYTLRTLSVMMGLCEIKPSKSETSMLEIYVEAIRFGYSTALECLVAMLSTLSVKQSKLGVCRADQADQITSKLLSEFTARNGATDLQNFVHRCRDLPVLERFNYQYYVVVRINYFGQSTTEMSEMLSYVQKPTARLLKVLNNLENVEAALWPSRFATTIPEQDDRTYEGFYLIGINERQICGTFKQVDVSQLAQTSTRPDITAKLHAWNSSTRQSLELLRWGRNAYVEAEAQIGKLSVNDKAVGSMDEDTGGWTVCALDDGALIDLTPLHREALPDPQPDPLTMPIPVRGEKAAGSGPLRPANVILKKLKNDPSFDSAAYEVGYGDLGMINWKLVKNWASDTTDEDFIPESRIWYFREITSKEGHICWDRSRRIDLLRKE